MARLHDPGRSFKGKVQRSWVLSSIWDHDGVPDKPIALRASQSPWFQRSRAALKRRHWG